MTATAVAPPDANANGAKPTRPTLQEACQQAVSAITWVKSENVESDALIALLFLSAITGRHGFIVGEGGTGKSKAVRDWMRTLPGATQEKFVTQFRKDMDTQAAFGPIAISGLMNDDFRHAIEGYMVDSLWVYADEFTDASTLILRSLLMLMEERQFPNGKHLVDAKLRALIGTSNFWRTDGDVAALMDRFAWRFVKDEVVSETGVLRIMDGQLKRRAAGAYHQPPTPAPTIALDALDVLTEAADTCDVPMAVRKAAFTLKAKALSEGVKFSNRRLGEGLALAQGRAVLAGRTAVTMDDLIVFQDVIASDPDDIPTAYQLCADFAGAGAKEANKLRKTLDPLQAKIRDIKAVIDSQNGKIELAQSQELIPLISEVKIVVSNADAKINAAKRDGEDATALETLKADAEQTHTYAVELATGGFK